MRIFTFHGMSVRIHPLFALMLLPFLLDGMAHVLCAYLLVLFLHEAGHYWAARQLHIQIAQLEITPFGGSMQINLSDALPPGKAFLLSAAGPAVNFICLFISSAIYAYTQSPSEWLLCFLSFHAVMLFTNLLPALPLDGGRMLLALLSRFISRAILLKALLVLGRMLALTLILSGIFLTLKGQYTFSPCILGAYLLYASALEEKNSASRYLAAFIARRVKLEKYNTLPVQHLAACADMQLFMLIPHLRPGAYHTVSVLSSDAATLLGQIHEEALLSAVLQSCSATLGDLLASNNSSA